MVLVLGSSFFSYKSFAREDIHPFKIPLFPGLADPGTTLYFSITCHVEPFEGGRVPDYRDEKYFRAQVQSLMKFTQMLEKHGAKLTLQVQQPFTDSLMKWDNPLPELEKRGHEIGTHFHEDHWVNSDAPREERLQALKDMKASVDQLGVQNTGLCGGWLWPDLGEIAYEAGFRYLDNYKNAKTQKGLDQNRTVFPYRMKGGPLYVTEGRWPRNKKGLPSQATPEDFDRLSRMLNMSFIDLVPDKICTANVVMHLSDFNPRNEDSLISLYDAYFSKVLDPAAQSGLIKYSTISESGKLFEEQVGTGIHFFAFNKAMPKDPLPLQRRGVRAIERIREAVGTIPTIKLNTHIEPTMTEEEYLNGLMESKISKAFIWEELDKLAQSVTDQDTVLVYSHCHGVRNKFAPGEPWGGLLLDSPPRDGSPLPRRGVTPWPEYMEKILSIPAKTVVVMVMSCYSGGLIDYLWTIEDQWGQRTEEGRNFVVLTSQNALLMSGPVKIENEFINPFTFALEQAFLGKADGFSTGEVDGKIDMNEWIQYILHTTQLHDENAHPMAIGTHCSDLVLFDLNS